MANGLWELVEKEIQVLLVPTQVVEHNLKGVKAREFILDDGKDHIIPQISGKHTTHDELVLK